MATPEQERTHAAFRNKYGAEPTGLNLDMAIWHALLATDEISNAIHYRGIRRLNFEEERLRADRILSTASRASAYLYVDGPVNGFPAEINVRPVGARADQIARDFSAGKTEGYVDAFKEVTEILSQVSGVDLTWLNRFSTVSFRNILKRAQESGVELSPEQVSLLERRGLLDPEERRRARSLEGQQ